MEVVTGEFSKYRNNLIDEHVSLMVTMWDCGPEEPVMPTAPEPPEGKPGEPKFDLAAIKFKRQLAHYEDALIRYEHDAAAYDDWRRTCGGPIEHVQWSCDAQDTLKNDQRAVSEGRQARRRWFISSRTRGYERSPNLGLPEGLKPGHGQAANVDRQNARDQDLIAAQKSDPLFGAA